MCVCTCVCMYACVCLCMRHDTQAKVGGQTPLWSHFSPPTSVWLPGMEPGFPGFQQMCFPSEPSHWPWPLWHSGSLTVTSELCGTHLPSSSDPFLQGADDCRHPARSIPAAGSCAADPGKWEICSNGCKFQGSLSDSQPDGRGRSVPQ